MVLSSSLSDDQAEVRRRGRRLTTARLVLGTTTVLLALVLAYATGSGAAAVGLPTLWVLVLPLVIMATAGGWLWWTLFPRHREVEAFGMGVNVLDEPELFAWVADLAHELGVDPPGGIRISPSTGAWISDLDGSPSLVIGIGSLAWLTELEFERLVAMEVSMLRVRSDESVGKALRFGRDLDVERLTQSTLPLVGAVVRWSGRVIERRREALYAACVTWAVSAAPIALRARAGDAAEAKIVDEGWEVLADRWLAPAAEAGLAVASLATAHVDLLRAFEKSDLIERTWVRPDGPAAIELLKDGDATDRAVSKWRAQQDPELSTDLVAWDDYLERVTMTTWRETAAEAVAAASQALGTDAPVTAETLLRALESGWAEVIGQILVEDAVDDDDERDVSAEEKALRPPIHSSRSEDAIVRALSHTVSLAAVEQMAGSAVLDLLWGVRIEDFNGKPMEIEATMRSFCRTEDWIGLRQYVEGTGLDPRAAIRVGPSAVARAIKVPARAVL